jgi:hypothetical protein
MGARRPRISLTALILSVLGGALELLIGIGLTSLYLLLGGFACLIAPFSGRCPIAGVVIIAVSVLIVVTGVLGITLSFYAFEHPDSTVPVGATIAVMSLVSLLGNVMALGSQGDLTYSLELEVLSPYFILSFVGGVLWLLSTSRREALGGTALSV